MLQNQLYAEGTVLIMHADSKDVCESGEDHVLDSITILIQKNYLGHSKFSSKSGVT